MKYKIITLILSVIISANVYSQSSTLTPIVDLLGKEDISHIKVKRGQFKLNIKGQLLIADTRYLYKDSLTYDKKGNILSIFTSTDEGKPREKIIPKYNNDNTLIDLAFFVPYDKGYYLNSTLKLDEEKKDKKGKIKKYKHTNGQSNMEYHFNNKGLLTKKIKIFPSYSEYNYVKEYEYYDFEKKENEKGQSDKGKIMLENKFVLSYNSDISECIIPEYNNSHNTNFKVKSEKHTELNQNKFSLITYKYNSEGLVKKMTKEEFKNNKLTKKEVYEYKYVFDNQCNWIKKIVIINNKKNYESNRVITYR